MGILNGQLQGFVKHYLNEHCEDHCKQAMELEVNRFRMFGQAWAGLAFKDEQEFKEKLKQKLLFTYFSNAFEQD